MQQEKCNCIPPFYFLLSTFYLSTSCSRVGAVSCDTYNTRRGLRSLPHLREQFKPRTDDGHASPVYQSCEGSGFSELSRRFLTLVRFFVYRRIKPHNPLLVQVPVYSFEFQPCGRTSQADLLTRQLRLSEGRYSERLEIIVQGVDYWGI